VSKKSRRQVTQKPQPGGQKAAAKSARIARLKLFLTRNRRILIPALMFFVIVGIFISLYYWLVESQPFHSFMAITANITAFFLKLTGQDIVVRDTLVSSPQFAFQIVDLCTAVMPMLILTAAILAFPSRVKEKLIGLAVGLVGIFLVNQVRLVSLYFIGAYAPSIFETAHLLVWQSLMILLAIGLWLIWVFKYVRPASL
jgi:archaeosortase B (VPXXXP-CTERM-specific)